MKNYLLIILLFIGCLRLWGQQRSTTSPPPMAIDTALQGKYRVGIMAKSMGDRIVVRWAPNNSSMFRQVLATGYTLTRRSAEKGKPSKLDFQLTVKPLAVADWVKKFGKNDTLAAACAQLVHGKNTPIGALESVTLDKIMQQQNQNDFRLMLALVLADQNPDYAQGMALGWVDTKVTKGVQYFYYIVPLTDPKVYPVAVAGTAVIHGEANNEPLSMMEVRTEAGEHKIKLKWSRQMTEPLFSSYFIERSSDGGKSFRRLNKLPWIHSPANVLDDVILYTDSVPQNYRSYHYRVQGVTPFGELAPSPIAKANAVDKTPPPAVSNLSATHLQGARVRVKWEVKEPTADLLGFIIAKGASTEGPFVPLSTTVLAPSTREFLDTAAIAYLPNYYRVVAVDTSKNVGIGFPAYCIIKDAKGPTKPKNLQGYIDTTGFVRIVWDMNTEPDLLGYRVASANAKDHVFTVDTKGYLALPIFNDTTVVNTLTRKKYFRVIAYDKNYNSSEPSDILELTRPDVVRPVAPVIKSYTVNDTSVILRWVPSSSDDVVNQVVFRRGKSSERWVEMAKLDPKAATYIDPTVKGDNDYGYAIVAVDGVGLKSDFSFPLNVHTPRITPPAVNNLKAILNADKTVTLSWGYSQPNCRYIVYRSLVSEGLRSYEKVYDNRTFTDKAPLKGKTQYAVRVLAPNGMESRLSQLITVDIK